MVVLNPLTSLHSAVKNDLTFNSLGEKIKYVARIFNSFVGYSPYKYLLEFHHMHLLGSHFGSRGKFFNRNILKTD